MAEGSIDGSVSTAAVDASGADSGLLIAEDGSEAQGAVRMNVRAFTFR